VEQENPDALLVGEHFHDYLDDLDGSGWQGVMNYAGFSKPVWSWLTRPDLEVDNWMGIPWSGWPRTPGTAMVGSMRAFSAVAWQHRRASMLIVSSHDSPRIRTITGDPALVAVAVAAMMTIPGLPMVWAGDEIGQEGISGEDARRPFPWRRPEQWDTRTMQVYRELIALRRDNEALRSGSMRWIFADADRVVYLRESASQRVLVLLARAAGPKISLPVGALGLQDGQQFDTLYSDASAHRQDARLILPGDGPGVGMWRW
jgi:alpha-glucosidase